MQTMKVKSKQSKSPTKGEENPPPLTRSRKREGSPLHQTLSVEMKRIKESKSKDSKHELSIAKKIVTRAANPKNVAAKKPNTKPSTRSQGEVQVLEKNHVP